MFFFFCFVLILNIKLKKKKITIYKYKMASETNTLSTNYRYQSIFTNNGKGEGFEFTSKNPRFWGPSFWTSMFSTVAKYPRSNPTREEAQRMKTIFLRFRRDLPCSKCEVSYRELIARFPIDEYLENRKKLMTWLYIIRDQINRKLICLERRELEQEIGDLPEGVPQDVIDKLKRDILYTKPSPPLNDILKKWYFYHERDNQ
jgi:hypothetical protein